MFGVLLSGIPLYPSNGISFPLEGFENRVEVQNYNATFSAVKPWRRSMACNLGCRIVVDMLSSVRLQ